MKFYDVVIENKSKYTDSAFTYKGEDGISVGALVRVPFGTYNSQKQGIVIDLKEDHRVRVLRPHPRKFRFRHS